MAHDLLVIVPCGQKKIWDRFPDAGPTLAMNAYTGSPFTVNKQYAASFTESWLILSAKYGFIDPQFMIPGPYNITFKRKKTNPVSVAELRDQISQQGLNQFSKVIGLGGKEYRAAIEAAFEGTPVQLHFPFSGLKIGKMMQATKRAITDKSPFGKGTSSIESTATLETDAVSKTCHTLHQWFSGMPVFEYPLPLDQIPKNGIYVLFENGEKAHGGNRIVRVGTHTGSNQLRPRLTQHFVQQNKDRSIFRKNIGRCLLNRNNDPFLVDWDLDLTTRAAKNAHADRIDFNKQNEVEELVSEYMRSHFRFVVFEVPDKEKRLLLESRITSTVSLCDQCHPTRKWIGLDSPKKKIRESGLWQVNELYKTPFSVKELEELAEFLPPK